jgi:hypothetical protein
LLDIQRASTHLGGYYGTDNGKGIELTPTRPKRAHTHDASINPANVTHHHHDSIGTISSGVSYFQHSARKSGDNTETSASPSTITSQGSPPPSGGFAPTGLMNPLQNITRLSSGSEGNAEDEATYLSRSTVVQTPWLSDNGADIVNEMSLPSVQEVNKAQTHASPCPLYKTESNLPKLSIDDVLKWRSRRKSQMRGKENEKLEHHDYLNRVKDRDHVSGSSLKFNSRLN